MGFTEDQADDVVRFHDQCSTAFRDARTTVTIIERATAAQARSAFIRIYNVGVQRAPRTLTRRLAGLQKNAFSEAWWHRIEHGQLGHLKIWVERLLQIDLPYSQSQNIIHGTSAMTSAASISLPTDTNESSWTPEMVALLGKSIDREVAVQLGLNQRAVFMERQTRGIAAYRLTKPMWTDTALSLLGTMSDQDAATKLGFKKSQVMVRRTSLGIAAYKPAELTWTAEMVALLGKSPDPKVATKLGLHVLVVYRERKRRSIPAFDQTFLWTDEAISLLGTISDPDTANRLGITKNEARNKRASLKIAAFALSEPLVMTQEFIDQLGKVSDKKIAKAIGAAQSTVSSYRRKLGIPTPFIFGETTPELKADLGKDTDVNLSTKHGVTVKWVWRLRNSLGIPSYRKTPPENAIAATPST